MSQRAKHEWKRPCSVLVLVCTANNDVLLLQRTTPAGLWQSVTGSLRWGESARQAAARELYEETGLLAGSALIDCRTSERFPIVPPWASRYSPHARFNQEHWFLLRLPFRRLIRLAPTEHRQYRWLPASRAARQVFSWTNRKAIERYCIGGGAGR